MIWGQDEANRETPVAKGPIVAEFRIGSNPTRRTGIFRRAAVRGRHPRPIGTQRCRRFLAPDDVPALLGPGMTVFVAGGANEPATVLDAIRRRPAASADVTWIQSIVPGLNRFDFASLHDEARAIAFFITPETRASYRAGRIDFVPCQLRAVADLLGEGLDLDLAIVSVSAPRDGTSAQDAADFGAGLNCDFVDVVCERAGRVVAEVNSALPDPPDGPRIDARGIDFAVPVSRAPDPFPLPAPDETARAIARNVAGLVRDGDTIQTGIGSIPYAVLGALRDKNDLGLHSGILDDGVMELIERGVITGSRKTIDRGRHVTAYAIGSPALYGWLAERADVRFRPVNYTHAAGTLARIDRFVSINSALEIDLAGQVNAEMIRGAQVTGTGGSVDFMRGAASSRGGRSIVALGATAAQGKVSRIVPRLGDGNAPTALRTDVDYVVTEHGVADLRFRPERARAAALADIAAPEFRAGLRSGERR